jgi:hypothetical protein
VYEFYHSTPAFIVSSDAFVVNWATYDQNQSTAVNRPLGAYHPKTAATDNLQRLFLPFQWTKSAEAICKNTLSSSAYWQDKLIL